MLKKSWLYKFGIVVLLLLIRALLCNTPTVYAEYEEDDSGEVWSLLESRATSDMVFNGNSTWHGYFSGNFTIGGKTAFCMQHEKYNAPSGTSYTLSTYDNETIKKLLYYGYKGPKQWSGFENNKAAVVITSHALSYYFDGTPKKNDSQFEYLWNNGLQSFIDYCAKQSIPSATLSLSSTSVIASVDKANGYQKTATIKLNGNSNNSITFKLDSGMKLYNSSEKKWYTEEGKVKGGQSFYITAPYSKKGTWSSGTVSGTLKSYTVKKAVPSGNYQTMGYLLGSSPSSTKVSLQVTFGGAGYGQVQKKSSNTSATNGNTNYALNKAVYGVYSDKSCSTKLGTLTTGTDGKSENMVLSAGTYYVKESVEPKGYYLDKTVYELVVTAGQTTTLSVTDVPITGSLTVIKKSADPSTTNGNTNYSLKGAEFKLYQGNTVVKNLTTDGNGKASASGIPLGTYTLKETKAPTGYERNTGTWTVTISETNKEYSVTVEEKPITGSVSLIKKSGNPSLTNGNRCYSLEGAVFKLYRGNEVVKTLTTNGDGKASVSGVPFGVYTLKETTAPKGFELDRSFEKTIQITDTQTSITLTVEDPPISERVGVLLRKVDADTETNMPQGGATLKGAQYTVKYYDSYYSKISELEGKQAVRTWVLQTDENGECRLDKKWLVSGDEFYYHNGTATLPLGTVVIRETKAPTGYLLSEEVFIYQIKGKDGQGRSFDYNEPIEKEKVKKGEVTIYKYGVNPDNPEDEHIPLSGIRFVFTSKTNEKRFVLETDEDGKGVLKDLPYDTYEVTEENTPSNYIPCEPFEVKVTEEGEQFSYTVENKEVRAAITIVKKDAKSDKIIPVDGTTFQILDEKKNVISLRCEKEEGGCADTFQTDGSGMLLLPERLPCGTYYLEELVATEGYLKGELLEFEITQNYDWESPMELVYYNENAMGQIELTKVSSEDGTSLSDAEFTITAAEDIATPDGTVYVYAGEIVDVMVTDEEGNAVSKKLYLGTYLVTETKAPEGYAREEKEYLVELIYKDQETPLVTADMGKIENNSTKIILKKLKKDTEDGVPGVTFEVWVKGTEEKQSYVTNSEGEIYLEKLLSGKTYCIQEVKTPLNYVLNPTIKEIVVDENGYIDGKVCYEYILENAVKNIKSTEAICMETQTQNAPLAEVVTIIDTVNFENLVPGEEYQIKGILMDKETGKPILEDRKEVRSETSFVAEKSEESVEVSFQIDGRNFVGKTIVVFEQVFLEETKIMAHEEMEAQSQSIYFPQITTVALDEKSESHSAWIEKEMHLCDMVSYCNLIQGQEYTVKGILMDKETGEALIVDGKEVCSEMSFIPENTEGAVEVLFCLDGTNLTAKNIVVYEKVYLDGVEIAAHEDLEDENQSILFEKRLEKIEVLEELKQSLKRRVPLTEDNQNLMIFIVCAILSCVTLMKCVSIFRKNR